MDMYKFGNYICRLREEKGMTQTELAFKLDVSDKTVSKWENGQAFPRIETFERLAQVLGTTMQDILSASRDGVRRVCFLNQMCPVVQIEVNGVLAVLRYEECQWLEVESEEIVLKILGDGKPVLSPEAQPDSSRGERFFSKAVRFAAKLEAATSLHAECTYRLTGVREDTILTITRDCIDYQDPAWIFPPFNTSYPRVAGDGVTVELLQARAVNRRDAVSAFRKWGILGCFDDQIFLLPLLLPSLGLYARWQCRRKVIEKRIRTIDSVRAKEESQVRKFGGCVMAILVGVLSCILIGFVARSLLFDEGPFGRVYRVSADRAAITCEDEVYVPVDTLPEDVQPVTFLGAEVWEDAVIESERFLAGAEHGSKVQLFEDHDGTVYLWLVEDYEKALSETDLVFGEFEEHQLYCLVESE